jgi:Na+/melibiose symporter-like transporter
MGPAEGVGGFVVVFLAIYLTAVRGLNAAQAGAVISAYCRGLCCWVNA